MDETQAGPIRRRRWWLLRIVRRAVLLLFRLLDRVAPHFTDLLGTIIEKAHDYQQTIRIARPDVLTMRVGEVRFRLCLAGGSEEAHRVYPPLAQQGKVYEPMLVACLSRFLQRLRDPAFMDIGAFMGYFTCYAAALLRDQRPVLAVESNPVYYKTIQRTVALNGFTRVHVLQAALSDRPRTVTIDDTAVLPTSKEGHGLRTVQAVTLDELCSRESISPTIVKIDVYGAEGMVMRGMSHLLEETIQVVLLELHPLSEYQSCSPGFTRAETIELLERSGFSIFHVAGLRGDHLSGLAAHREQGRFAYFPLTAATRQPLLFDRPHEILVLACKDLDLAELLGPSLDLTTVVG